MNNNVRLIVLSALGVVALIFLVANSPFFVVAPGQVGVTFNRLSGSTKSHSQGTHFRIPFVEGLVKFDVKTQRHDVKAESASKDLQEVKVQVVVNYHLLYEQVNDLFVKVGVDFNEKVVDPAVNECVKAATAQFPVEQIITQRQHLKELIESNLSKKLDNYYIKVESVSLVDITFSEQFNHSVEQKQIEEQKIKTVEYQRMQAEEMKKKTILEAEAEGEKQRILKISITENIVALEWIKKWNGQLPTTMAGEKSVMMFGLTGGNK